MSDIEYIKEHVSKRDILARLYEATADLGYSTLKLRQAMGCKGLPADDYDGFFDSLIEKSADVRLCMSLLWNVESRADAIRLERAAAWRKELEEHHG